MRDFDLTREFAEAAAKEWVAVGIRKGYMYMADLATEPRWGRTEGTFGDDADLAAKMIREISQAGGLFRSNGQEINIELSNNNIDVAYVNRLKVQKPTVAVNFSNPWVISEIDNGDLNTMLATFGTSTDALLDVLSGKFKPTGKMPFTIPASREAVTNNLADVPGAQEAEGYSVFNFDDGISCEFS